MRRKDRGLALHPAGIASADASYPWRDVADIGNVIRHAYGKVDAEIIWTAVRKDFVSLEDAVRTILAGIPDDV
jgi:uncharacterized protein with HEPN domain